MIHGPPNVKFLCVYKGVVSDEKYYILFVNISTNGCPLSKKKNFEPH